MYQLEYLDLEENKEYEEIIKKVVEQCFKEEKIENIESNLSNTKNEELEVLKELYEKGVITEDEYNDKKERLLSK